METGLVGTIFFIYEIPLIIFVVLAIYTINRINKTRASLEESVLKNAYMWFLIATGFLTLWGVGHIINDLVTVPENLQLFGHYIISHGFLLFAMICIAIAAKKTQEAYSTQKE